MSCLSVPPGDWLSLIVFLEIQMLIVLGIIYLVKRL